MALAVAETEDVFGDAGGLGPVGILDVILAFCLVCSLSVARLRLEISLSRYFILFNVEREMSLTSSNFSSHSSKLLRVSAVFGTDKESGVDLNDRGKGKE